MRILWTYVIGPLLAFLPRRWRQALASGGEVQWKHAGTLSGLLESIGGIVVLGYWYLYGMQKMVDAGVSSALSGNFGPGVTDQVIGGASLVIMATHSVTWVLAFFVVEGAVRLCAAAFAESVVATLPLAMVAWLAGIFRTNKERTGETVKRNAESFAVAVKERLLESRAKDLADELSYQREGEEEYLEIRASRKKEEWLAPKVVRVNGVYYRLEESGLGKGARPFWYRLKKLAAGVPGRNVIFYSSAGGKSDDAENTAITQLSRL